MLLVPDLVIWFEAVVGVKFPSKTDFVQKHLSIKPKFVCFTTDPLITDPPPKRLVLLVLEWHPTTSIHSFELDHLFMLMVPDLVIGVAGTFNFPKEPDSVQNCLSVWLNFVILMKETLFNNPLRKSLVLLVPGWHHTVAMFSFKVDKLFMFHMPFLIKFRHGSHF
jgi:hypothetical protein